MVSTGSTNEVVFIANRGEIAERIARTCERLGIRAVRSTGDFLDPAAQVAQAREAGARAVHPGYGFLSENAAFARAVTAAQMTWIGPPPEAMEAMARKDRAREIAVAAGVPVVPRGEDAGFPVLVKAAAGGGGKGMRVVRSAAELAEAKAAAAREAASAFGDDTLLVEKYVERGRHIEVQVFGDAHGNVIHLGTRDCSAQRRHQKVVEEAPAPTLTQAQRTLVQDAAVALARKVGYTNAGTVEFLLDEATGEAYFLEMNTRLQVEHPVTEEVTGLDLVELQLKVAGGAPLGIAQDQVTLTGHAIEVRVYAEDPYAGFLPQAGTARLVRWPGSGEGLDTLAGARYSTGETAGARYSTGETGRIRVDHALESGQVVSTAFDPMLGKVIGYGPDRETARRALLAALDDTAILGITTNTGFLRRLVGSAEFRDAEVDTAWLDSPRAEHLLRAPEASDEVVAAAAAQLLPSYDDSPFGRGDGWRSAGPVAPLRVAVTVDGAERTVEIRESTRHNPGINTYRTGRGVWVTHQGQPWWISTPDAFDRSHAEVGQGTIASPMPGTVLDVRVAEGDAVAQDQVLGVVEAMKMELALRAPYPGRVTHVGVVAGQQVALGAELFTVEPIEGADV